MSEHTRMASRNLAKVVDDSRRRESVSLFVIAQMSIVIAEALEQLAALYKSSRPDIFR